MAVAAVGVVRVNLVVLPVIVTVRMRVVVIVVIVLVRVRMLVTAVVRFVGVSVLMITVCMLVGMRVIVADRTSHQFPIFSAHAGNIVPILSVAVPVMAVAMRGTLE